MASEENAEKVRAFAEGVMAGDPHDLGDLSFLDENISYVDEILPDHVGETYHGIDGFRKAWARALEPWTDLSGALEWIVAEGDIVVSCHYGHMRGRESGVEAEITYAYVWRFRDGKVVHCRSLPDADSALRAAGIERA